MFLSSGKEGFALGTDYYGDWRVCDRVDVLGVVICYVTRGKCVAMVLLRCNDVLLRFDEV